MKKTTIVFGLTVLASTAALVGFTTMPRAARTAETTANTLSLSPSEAVEQYGVDAVHSTVVFRINHLGVATFWGRFNQISGAFTYDTENPSASTFQFSVPTESVDSGNAGRDRHLKTPDFFNAREHAAITFKSTAIAPTSTANVWDVTGDLSLHGVTKPVTVRFEWIGAAETSQGYKRGFEAVMVIKRSEFGMDKYLDGNALGDEVKIIVAVEGKRE